MPSLGRVLHPPVDHRDSLHPFSAVLPAPTVVRPKYRYWAAGPFDLNQGNVGACVAFAGENAKQASPLRTIAANVIALENYRQCKLIDGYPGEGTWDRILMKVYQDQGRVERYLWAQSFGEMVDWLLTKGGVMVGVPWYDSMFTPDSEGVLRVNGPAPSQGHEFFVRGTSTEAKAMFKCVQSWGHVWGLGGEFWLSWEDMERIVFREDGDCLAWVEKKAP